MQHLPILKICSCPCQAGPKPGRVIYTDYRTIITAADEALAERLRKD